MEHDGLEEHLAGIFPEQEQVRAKQAGNESEITAFVGPAGSEREALAQTNATPHRWIAECARQQSARRCGGAIREWRT
jgi:hypothetical protein